MTFVGDNATSNDKQTEHLNQFPNTFDSVNRVRCFNHTLQLSVKALLRPFASAASTTSPAETYTAGSSDDIPDDDSDVVTLEEVDNEEEEMEDGDDEDTNDKGNTEEGDAEVDEAFDNLTDEERMQLLDNTSAICTILDKVQFVLMT